MNIQHEQNAIYAALDKYRLYLDEIPDVVFNTTPAGGGWSSAEVYSHILQATLGAAVAMERCASNTCIPTDKGVNLPGYFILTTGIFPRVKVPDNVAAKMPVANIDKEEARNLIIKCRKRIDDIAPMTKEAEKTSRHKHPRLGFLNAEQWLKFIRIHLYHHLKQLKRIEKKF